MKQQRSAQAATTDSDLAEAMSDTLSSAGTSLAGTLDALDLPSLEQVQDTGSTALDWLGQALAESSGDAGVQTGLMGFIAEGLGDTDDHGVANDALILELQQKHGLSLALATAWADHIAGSSLGEAECWGPLNKVLVLYRGRADAVTNVIKAVDLLQAPDAQDRPADALRQFAVIYSALAGFMPYTPVMSEFLGVYGELLMAAADRLDELAVVLRLKDEELGFVYQEGAYSGGISLTTYLKDLHRDKVRDPPGSVVEWVMGKTDILTMATGEAPPVEKREVFGVDFLAPDNVNLGALTDWFMDHLHAIGRLVWGDLVDSQWGQGEQPCPRHSD